MTLTSLACRLGHATLCQCAVIDCATSALYQAACWHHVNHVAPGGGARGGAGVGGGGGGVGGGAGGGGGGGRGGGGAGRRGGVQTPNDLVYYFSRFSSDSPSCPLLSHYVTIDLYISVLGSNTNNRRLDKVWNNLKCMK